MDTRTKIVDLERATQIAAELRANGRRLILADGYFDVLQAGHARVLGRLRRDGAAVLVAVYDDAALCKMRKQPQPILSEQARAQMVAALGGVDYVLIWPETVLDALIATLLPDQVEHVPDERNIIVEIRKRIEELRS